MEPSRRGPSPWAALIPLVPIVLVAVVGLYRDATVSLRSSPPSPPALSENEREELAILSAELDRTGPSAAERERAFREIASIRARYGLDDDRIHAILLEGKMRGWAPTPAR
jgi:hypothetical protein